MILTQEQELIRDSMRAFAQERLAPFAGEWDRNHTFPAEALKELGALGALGMVVPEEWDGAGMDYMSLVLTLEETRLATPCSSRLARRRAMSSSSTARAASRRARSSRKAGGRALMRGLPRRFRTARPAARRPSWRRAPVR